MDNEDYRLIRKLCLADDLAFAVGLKGNKECASLIVNMILGRSDIVITSVHTQEHTMDAIGHSVIFDMYAHDRNGRLIDVEMQRGKITKEELSARADYYDAMLMLGSLRSGQKYRRMRERFVIFILEKDVLGTGEAVSEFRYRRKGGSDLACAKGSIVMANAKYNGTMRTDLQSLYSDFFQENLDEIRNLEIRKALYSVKGDEEKIMKTYSYIEKFKAEGEERGFRLGELKGRKDGRSEVARNMLKANRPISEIVSFTNLSEEDVYRIASSLKQ